MLKEHGQLVQSKGFEMQFGNGEINQGSLG